MPRSKNAITLHALAAEEIAPLAGARVSAFQSAFQAIVTWGTSRTYREQLMRDSGFPLPKDLPAFLVINQLVYRGLATPTSLADAVDTTRSNMSRIIARLEDAALVFRAHDPRDARGTVIGLTASGRDLGTRVLDSMQDFGALDGWSAQEIEMLEQLTIKLAMTLDAFPNHPLTVTAGVSFNPVERPPAAVEREL
ncbi:MarR family winged helix-turn-helix transcriptional regulator [Microbacterium sp. ANT_H45B]|uniref:MarR family winged helix-turn-helix transcriptional regulator n=1 Tax=Microbacterium sp. ANT_H45B TaxID=2597346 RepID=UPI00165E9EE0|nr:MarR family winged helix-turn-helix transcriptional regulator [Microbacterium sp. ANT_H45B]